MKRLFADTFFWLALFLPNDPWASTVRSLDLAGARLITTEEVLCEFLAAVSSYGPRTRQLACELVREILSDPEIQVVEQSHRSFSDGVTLYERRGDKRYSLVDCVSMNTMRRLKIREVLTNDRHFAQEGFVNSFR